VIQLAACESQVHVRLDIGDRWRGAADDWCS
jgi:hypothetical protein